MAAAQLSDAQLISLAKRRGFLDAAADVLNRAGNIGGRLAVDAVRDIGRRWNEAGDAITAPLRAPLVSRKALDFYDKPFGEFDPNMTAPIVVTAPRRTLEQKAEQFAGDVSTAARIAPRLVLPAADLARDTVRDVAVPMAGEMTGAPALGRAGAGAIRAINLEDRSIDADPEEEARLRAQAGEAITSATGEGLMAATGIVPLGIGARAALAAKDASRLPPVVNVGRQAGEEAPAMLGGALGKKARPKADASVVQVEPVGADQIVKTSWGADLQAKAGRDVIVSKGPNDRWVVRKDIFDNTYVPAEGGFRKDPNLSVSYRIAEKPETIQTLEGPVGAAPGDYVLTGSVGEQWPVKPDKFAQRYDIDASNAPLVGGTPEARARAKEQGFDTERVLYHGTTRDFDNFKPSTNGQIGRGVYFAHDPELAGKYAQYYGDSGANVVPVHVRGKLANAREWKKALDKQSRVIDGSPMAAYDTPHMQGAAKTLREQGYSGIDAAGQVSIFDPANIRSVHAKFDPAQTRSPNILSAGAGPVDNSPPLVDVNKVLGRLGKKNDNRFAGASSEPTPNTQATKPVISPMARGKVDPQARQGEVEQVMQAWDAWKARYPGAGQAKGGQAGDAGSFRNFAASIGLTKNKAQGIIWRAENAAKKSAPRVVDEVAERSKRLGMSPEKVRALSAQKTNNAGVNPVESGSMKDKALAWGGTGGPIAGYATAASVGASALRPEEAEADTINYPGEDVEYEPVQPGERPPSFDDADGTPYRVPGSQNVIQRYSDGSAWIFEVDPDTGSATPRGRITSWKDAPDDGRVSPVLPLVLGALGARFGGVAGRSASRTQPRVHELTGAALGGGAGAAGGTLLEGGDLDDALTLGVGGAMTAPIVYAGARMAGRAAKAAPPIISDVVRDGARRAGRLGQSRKSIRSESLRRPESTFEAEERMRQGRFARYDNDLPTRAELEEFNGAAREPVSGRVKPNVEPPPRYGKDGPSNPRPPIVLGKLKSEKVLSPEEVVANARGSLGQQTLSGRLGGRQKDFIAAAEKLGLGKFENGKDALRAIGERYQADAMFQARMDRLYPG